MTLPPRFRMAPAWAGVTAIAATYVYFLLYAQFGFVSYLKLFFADPGYTERSMGAMGLGGLVSSLLTPLLLRRVKPARLLAAALTGCAASALLTLAGRHAAWFYLTAFLIGGATGAATVTLASSLRQWLSGPRLGLLAGLGTGLAYLVCNIPLVFDASPLAQTVLSALGCLLGAAVVIASPVTENASTGSSLRPSRDYAGWGFASVVAMFFALVWLDSTAFATIQLTGELRAHTWGTPSMKMGLGVFHFGAAVFAGWMIDRGTLKGLLVATFAVFATAFTLLQAGEPGAWTSGPLYAIGISIYSTALVAYPSLHKEQAGLVPVRWRAAILYAVAGWIGSGLGVGLAQHLHSIPLPLLVMAGLPVLLGAAVDHDRFRPLLRYAPVLLAATGGVMFFTVDQTGRVAVTGEPSLEIGRAVYRQEGCIHCHSQYIRPNNPRDVVWWGPYRAINRTEHPPMVGNRRQGPDLLNVGLRRTPEWHQQHLIAPTSLSPGSKMPSYAHLFQAGDRRGPSLVLYLSALGVAARTERLSVIQTWTPDAEGHVPSAENGRRVFSRNCTMCHGRDGRGDGPLSPLFFRPAMNLAKGPFFYAPANLPEQEQSLALSRIVTFGLVGLHMPGHETMDDRDVADVVAYVKTLATGSQ